jgi:hypothetical protein
MRKILCVLLPVLVLLVLLVGGTAGADEEQPAAPAPQAPPKPDPEPAIFISESLMPGEEDSPEGWARVDDESPQGPSEDELVAIADALDLDDDSFYPQLQAYQRGGDVVMLAMVDVDKKVYAYKHALGVKASERGWRLTDLGHPGRIMVLGGKASAVADFHEKMIGHTVYKLSDMAMNRLRNRAGNEEAGREAATTYTKYIGEIASGSGTAKAVVGIVHWIESRAGLEPKEKPKRDEEEKAIAQWEKALAEGVAYPPKGSVRVFVAGEMGSILLTWKEPAQRKRAIWALEVAVEHEADAKTRRQRQGNRYNLACGYSLTGRIDEAFDMLEKSLQILKNMPHQYWRQQYEHIAEKDADMGPLRADPRFSELIKRKEFVPPEPKKRRHPPKPEGGDENPHK